MENDMSRTERGFTIELGSNGSLKNVMMDQGAEKSVLLEGSIGDLIRASFSEGVILEVVGTSGTVRIDLRDEEVSRNRAEGER
jgi:hypothetical protein